MLFDPIVLSSLAQIAVAFAAAFVAALWLSLIFWTYRDIRRRTRDVLLRILASLVVTILFLPGILIYLILRPANTLEQEYQSTLEEEALLQDLEERAVCPGCRRKIEASWQVCPECHTILKKTCLKCGRLLHLRWNICPYCVTPAAEMAGQEDHHEEEEVAAAPTTLPESL